MASLLAQAHQQQAGSSRGAAVHPLASAGLTAPLGPAIALPAFMAWQSSAPGAARSGRPTPDAQQRVQPHGIDIAPAALGGLMVV